MKIISKFQDFYEFDCYRYGSPSEYPQWVRETESKQITIPSDNILFRLKKLFLNSYKQGNIKFNGKHMYSRQTGGMVRINVIDEVIGIYPYLYYIPVVQFAQLITGIDNKMDVNYTDMTPEDSKRILIEEDAYKEIVAKYNFDYKNCIYPDVIYYINKKKYLFRNIFEGRDIKKDPYVTEFKELFDLAGEPIIYLKYDNIRHAYKKNFKIYIDTNINLSKTRLLSYYPDILTERDVYTELENYIVSSLQEPISEPTNENKIVSHGFDLKTSFRNM